MRVERIWDPKKIKRGMSNIVRRNIIFLFNIILIAQKPTMITVNAYVKTILLNSKTSEVVGKRISGTKNKSMLKQIAIIIYKRHFT